MVKKISYFLYRSLSILDKILKALTKRSILVWFKDFFQEDSYKNIDILGKKIIFFTPNQLIDWRVATFFTKEPETLEWIDSFEKKEKLIFWDIGANIGLYSIYNALKNKNSTTISFEPSTSNSRVLTRNISINNLEENIKVITMPLSNKENSFQIMNEGKFVEGGALNAFGENFDFSGNKFEPETKYTLLGTTINFLIENKVLELPDYIKIDVDGIEHLILEGASKFLSNRKIKSLSIEINENFIEQYRRVLSIMKQNNFKILQKKNNTELLQDESKFKNIYNYIFIK
ncbi:FkbM family methyltransferase [Candidatus Pelagibacter sp. IMCC9063]|uniref:FkbM family methyltransferase n=1 Tax=Pelagibacter sp. (strain IMCC9063) TaxID=1002672 RepID=UPI000674A80D|nr:FkbM family methyltransferase [Candidatus Pelagibacter sp. IMCC9063]